MNFVRKILSGALAVLFLLSLFTISAFATSDYNKNDLNFIKTLVSRSALLSSDFDTTVSSELISAAEYLGDWSEQNGEKRLISLDLASVGIVDVSGKLDASSLAFLTSVNLSGNFDITELALPKNGKLSVVDISETAIKTLDLSSQSALTSLKASTTELESVNLREAQNVINLNLGAVSRFVDKRGVELKFDKSPLAKMVGMNYNFDTAKVTVTYSHEVGEVFLNKELLPSGATSVSQNLLEDGVAFAETTVWFTLAENMEFEPAFLSNSVDIEELTVDGVSIKPNGAGVYVAEVSADKTEIEVNVVSKSGAATIEGAGKLSLAEGENTFTIKVTSADGSNFADYSLKIIRTPTFVKKTNDVGIIIAVVAVVVIVGAAVSVIFIRKKNKK